MKNLHKTLLATALVAVLGASAIAQTPPPPQAGGRGPSEMMAHRGMDPAKMHEMRQLRTERRLAELKLKLAITPARESAWNAWATDMKPGAPRPRPDRAEFERMTTPERIDRMRAMRATRIAEMDRKADATKVFYTTLNTDQKKVFDGVSMQLLGGKRGGRGGHHGGGQHHG